MDRNRPLDTCGVLNFEFLLSFFFLFMMMVTWGLPKSGSFGKLRTFVDTHFWNKNRYVSTL